MIVSSPLMPFGGTGAGLKSLPSNKVPCPGSSIVVVVPSLCVIMNLTLTFSAVTVPVLLTVAVRVVMSLILGADGLTVKFGTVKSIGAAIRKSL